MLKKIFAILLGIVIMVLLWTLSETLFYYGPRLFKKTVTHIFTPPKQELPDWFHSGKTPLDSMEFSSEYDATYGKAAAQVPDLYHAARKYQHFGSWSYHKESTVNKNPDGKTADFLFWGMVQETKEEIYRVKIKMTESMFRVPSPVKPKNSSPHFAIVTGCSYVFGDGLPEEHTLTEFMQKKLKNFNVYNFGKQGAGPNSILAALDVSDGEPYQRVVENEGVFVYRFVDFHLDRALCPTECYKPHSQWMLSGPQYELQNGQVVRNGSFKDNRPILGPIYSYLAWSPTLKFFNVQIPPRYSRGDLEFFVKMVSAIKNRFEVNGQKRFMKSYFVFDPDISSNARQLYVEDLKEILKENNFTVIDKTIDLPLYEITKGRSQIPLDLHPTGKSNAVMAEVISESILADFN